MSDPNTIPRALEWIANAEAGVLDAAMQQRVDDLARAQRISPKHWWRRRG